MLHFLQPSASLLCNDCFCLPEPIMSFFPAATFSPVAAMVNYSSAIPTAVPLSQTIVADPLAAAQVASTLEREVVDCALTAPFSAGDPVTKAVMDNIMGTLPTRKPSGSWKCETCSLEFSGQVVLETHLAGAKHAKKVKSQEILKQLQTSGQTFICDEKSRILKCEVCEIVVNSSQQLQTHLSGSKHKQKALKKGLPLPSGVSPPMKNTPEKCTNIPVSNSSSTTVNNKNCNNKGSSGQNSPPEIPSCIQKTGDSKTNKYFCDICNVSLNSGVQLEQHLSSKRHRDRSSTNGKPKSRIIPYWKKKSRFEPFGNRPSNKLFLNKYLKPLCNDFITQDSRL